VENLTDAITFTNQTRVRQQYTVGVDIMKPFQISLLLLSASRSFTSAYASNSSRRRGGASSSLFEFMLWGSTPFSVRGGQSFQSQTNHLQVAPKATATDDKHELTGEAENYLSIAAPAAAELSFGGLRYRATPEDKYPVIFILGGPVSIFCYSLFLLYSSLTRAVVFLYVHNIIYIPTVLYGVVSLLKCRTCSYHTSY
jgi:hypothetical protein